MGDTEASRDRLIAAVLERWELTGAAGVSARSVARDAGIPVSSIYHHFGDMDGLLAHAADAALTQAREWCGEQSRILTGASGGPVALAHLLAATIDDWCERQRPLAYAWREAQLRGMRDPAQRGPTLAWSDLWHGFWRPICVRFGSADLAPTIVLLFDGEASMHMIRWRRLLDRSALSELCSTWAGWIEGRAGAPAPWRTRGMAEALAGRPAVPRWDATTERIAAAAARTVARTGVSGLTHRAVASEAGQTLGVVSNRFRSSADLMSAACEALYRRIVAPLGAETGTPLDLVGGQPAPPDGDVLLRAFFELALASSRDPALGSFAAQLRYSRGRTSVRHLRAVLGPEVEPSPADAALLSALLSGQVRARLCGIDTAEADRAIDGLLSLIRC